MTTQDYFNASKRLDALTMDLKWGNPLNHKKKLADIDKAFAIANMAFSICRAFAEPTKEAIEAENASNAAFALAKEYIINRFNRIHS